MTLTASIAERIGAKPKRTLVVGGMASFLKQTLEPKLAAWGLAVEWHREMGSRGPAPLPAGCEVVVYFYEMVANPGHVGPALKAQAAKVGATFIQASRKAATWEADFTRAGLKHDANYPLKDPIMPPPAAPIPAPVQPKPASLPPPPPRTYKKIIGELVSLLGELEEVLDKDAKDRATAEELLAQVEAAIKRAEVAEGKLKALDALRELLAR